IPGQSIPRGDIPAKAAGGEAYVQDIPMPGMDQTRVILPPRLQATIKAVQDASIEKLPGVLKGHRDGNLLAVMAARESQSAVAMNALAAATTWTEQETLPEQGRFFDYLKSLPAKNDVVLNRSASVATDGKTLSATFKRPYQMHGSIGPSCAIAQFNEDA